MSYIDFNYDNNSILVCKGDSKNRGRIEEIELSNNFKIYNFENTFCGIEISKFLSNLELDGLKGELKFKELLENNNIPYLYIGQGPFGIERSGILIEKTKSKRADFLVSINDMGTILFDVKCRNKISFHNNKEKYFTLFISELEALNNLQTSILMPVWLAFIDRNRLNNKTIFYFISISSLMKFWSGLFDYYINENEFSEIIALRIPNELFTKIDEKVIFEIGYQNISEKLLNDFAKLNIGLNRVIKDKIKETIRNKECLKSKIYEVLKNQNIDYCYLHEVNYHIEKLIDSKIIEYYPKKPLKLFGE